ncbi:helix-turn-helix domain-containing protein [Halorubrum sp. DTA98]|uniref:helix-turn-helix domain-containing protein n=1 Tax=Halorubrum sp. DTA98 TaxID=3402163 RepID=UPI003AAE2C6B
MSSSSSSCDVDPSERSHEGAVRMSLAVSDPHAARDLLVCLGDNAGISLSIDCVTQEGSTPCVITVDGLSDQQIETAEIAVERGYYEKPREVSLSELTEEFDVSNSAVSQRLSNVERKLVRSLVESCQA